MNVKHKGDREERAIVNLLREWGFTAKRTLESGARSDGSYTWDIDAYIRGDEHAPFIGESKHQQKIGDYIWDWMAENDFLTIRKNNKERLWVLPERVVQELFEHRYEETKL